MAGPIAMLAGTADPAQFADLCTPQYALERKIDGRRLLVTTGPDGPRAFNRAGQRANLPANVAYQFRDFEIPATFDGEYAQGTYHLFDLPQFAEMIGHADPWARRSLTLRRLLDRWGPDEAVIEWVPFVREADDKLDLMRRLQREGGEGVVLKGIHSPYEPCTGSKRSRHWRKIKFVQDLDCVIVGAGEDGKRNFLLGVYDDDGELVDVGKCSALTGDGPRALIGDVVTVTVLGIGSSGKLVEPTLPRRRLDKAPTDCLLSQLDTIRKIAR